jgi:PAS domain S-box-containing protein
MNGIPAELALASKRVLLVEDDGATAELMRRTLVRSGYSVDIAFGVEAGLTALDRNGSSQYTALLLDYTLPDGEPWRLADAAKARVPEVLVIFVTGVANEGVAIEALRRGFADYVKKTADYLDELPAILERVAQLSLIKDRLDQTSALMRAIVEQSSDLMAVCSGDGKLEYVSPVCLTLLGKDSAELVGRFWTEIVALKDRDALLAMLVAAKQSPAQSTTLRCCRKDGSLAWMEARVALLGASSSAEPMIVLTLHDVTEQREHEQQIVASLREKEVLLREIHHRVKNNLQVIQSLLKMRARLLPEGETRAAIEATGQRVHAMAMVHERLYQRKDVASLSLGDYLRDLFSGVENTSSAERGQIQVRVNAGDIQLDLDCAVPFGLLANELISNCFKHGFPNGRRGTIEISVHRVDGVVNMVVKDNGIGLRESFDAGASGSMGLKLAASLAHQLGGRLDFTSDGGCRIESNLRRL